MSFPSNFRQISSNACQKGLATHSTHSTHCMHSHNKVSKRSALPAEQSLKPRTPQERVKYAIERAFDEGSELIELSYVYACFLTICRSAFTNLELRISELPPMIGDLRNLVVFSRKIQDFEMCSKERQAILPKGIKLLLSSNLLERLPYELFLIDNLSVLCLRRFCYLIVF